MPILGFSRDTRGRHRASSERTHLPWRVRHTLGRGRLWPAWLPTSYHPDFDPERTLGSCRAFRIGTGRHPMHRDIFCGAHKRCQGEVGDCHLGS